MVGLIIIVRIRYKSTNAKNAITLPALGYLPYSFTPQGRPNVGLEKSVNLRAFGSVQSFGSIHLL